MNLVIDEGNTLCKCAWFDKDQIHEEALLDVDKVFSRDFWKKIKAEHVLLSTVKRNRKEFYNWLGNLANENIQFLDYESNLPLKLRYKTPKTLGNDRIAGAVAANAEFPGQHVLVIDAGTCITYDYVSANNEFYGGGISPGVYMRFKALNQFTARLPLIEKFSDSEELIGNSTEESIKSGVINGIKAEVEGIIKRYREKFPETKVIITGGDAYLFETKPKNNIFAQPNLVLRGLNKILLHNASL